MNVTQIIPNSKKNIIYNKINITDSSTLNVIENNIICEKSTRKDEYIVLDNIINSAIYNNCVNLAYKDIIAQLNLKELLSNNDYSQNTSRIKENTLNKYVFTIYFFLINSICEKIIKSLNDKNSNLFWIGKENYTNNNNLLLIDNYTDPYTFDISSLLGNFESFMNNKIRLQQYVSDFFNKSIDEFELDNFRKKISNELINLCIKNEYGVINEIISFKFLILSEYNSHIKILLLNVKNINIEKNNMTYEIYLILKDSSHEVTKKFINSFDIDIDVNNSHLITANEYKSLFKFLNYHDTISEIMQYIDNYAFYIYNFFSKIIDVVKKICLEYNNDKMIFNNLTLPNLNKILHNDNEFINYNKQLRILNDLFSIKLDENDYNSKLYSLLCPITELCNNLTKNKIANIIVNSKILNTKTIVYEKIYYKLEFDTIIYIGDNDNQMHNVGYVNLNIDKGFEENKINMLLNIIIKSKCKIELSIYKKNKYIVLANGYNFQLNAIRNTILKNLHIRIIDSPEQILKHFAFCNINPYCEINFISIKYSPINITNSFIITIINLDTNYTKQFGYFNYVINNKQYTYIGEMNGNIIKRLEYEMNIKN